MSFVAHEPWHDENGPRSQMECGMLPDEQGCRSASKYGGGAKFPLPDSAFTGHFCGNADQWLGRMSSDNPADIGQVGCCQAPRQRPAAGGVKASGSAFFFFTRTSLPIPGTLCPSVPRNLCARITRVDGDGQDWVGLDIHLHCAGDPFVGWFGSVTHAGQTFTAHWWIDHIDPISHQPVWNWDSGGCSLGDGQQYGPSCNPLPLILPNSAVDACVGGPGDPVPNNFNVTLYRRCPTTYFLNCSGGVKVGGRSRVRPVGWMRCSGGVKVGGHAFGMIGKGGVKAGGSCIIGTNLLPCAGGVKVGGSSHIRVQTAIRASQGVKVGGTGTFDFWPKYIRCTGGVQSGGTTLFEDI